MLFLTEVSPFKGLTIKYLKTAKSRINAASFSNQIALTQVGDHNWRQKCLSRHENTT
jgi:hypothetical protein